MAPFLTRKLSNAFATVIIPVVPNHGEYCGFKALTNNAWNDPEQENVLSHFDMTLNKVFLSKKKENSAVFVLEELPHKQFEVPSDLMHIYKLRQENSTSELEAIFIYEAFLGVFKYFINDSFASIREYQMFSEEILGEMKDIAQHLDKVSQDVGISRMFGGLAGATGGIMCVVGVALSPVTMGASTIVSAVGVSVGLAGGVTSSGAWIAEEVLKKIDKDSFKEKFEKFKSASEIIHAFSYEFVKKSSDAGLWKENRSDKISEVLSSISNAFQNCDSIKDELSTKNTKEDIAKAGKFGWKFVGQVKGLVKSIKLITKASNVSLGTFTLGEDVAKVGDGVVRTGLVAALTDDALINLSTGVASGVKTAQVSSLAFRSFSGALSSVGVVFSLADIVMGALQVRNKSELAAKLSENLSIVEEGNDCAIDIFCDLVSDL